MDLARYVVDAVVLEGRSYREVVRAHGVSKSWVGKLVAPSCGGGYEATKVRFEHHFVDLALACRMAHAHFSRRPRNSLREA